MNTEQKFYSMLVDTTLKYLFKSSITRKILENIIKEITDIDLNGYILVDNELNKKDAYLSFLTTKSYEEVIKVANNNEELMILESEIERLNQDEYFGGLYDASIVQKKLENSARLVGYDEGKAEGLLEGENKEKKENSIAIAKLMLQKKYGY